MIADLRRQLDNKEISSVELTQRYLDNIKKRNEELNAFVLVAEEYALEQARAADKEISQGATSVLTGIPYNLKDVFCVKGIETTACSNILKGYIPPYTAPVVERLGGAVLLGKTNTDEFTCGASSENSCFGPTVNPHDTKRVAGGSSGGPAASVAADMSVFSLGTDTGGSIRLPSAFCGTVGLRPTYGRVPRYGVISMASSLDTIGPIASTVEDLAIVLEQIAGVSPFDGTTVDQPVAAYRDQLNQPVKGLTIGVPTEYMEMEGLHPEVRKQTEVVIEELRQQGAVIKQISLPYTKYAVPTYYIIVPSEVSSNMARYDGIKYGYRAEDAEQLLDIYEQSRAKGFGSEMKRRIMIGTYALSAGYYDAYYLKAMRVRTLIRQDFATAFKTVDVIVTPTTPTPAFKVGEVNDLIQMYVQDVFSIPASLAGIPGLVVPSGMVDHLPISVQILGPQWSEPLVLNLGYRIEQIRGKCYNSLYDQDIAGRG